MFLKAKPKKPSNDSKDSQTTTTIMSVRSSRKRKVPEKDLSEQPAKRRNLPRGFPDEIPFPFKVISHGRMDELRILDSYDGIPNSDLPETLHPIFEWSPERWLGINVLTHSRLLPALRLASYLLFQNGQVREFFTRAWFAETTTEGIQSRKDDGSRCLPPRLLLPLDTIGNMDQMSTRAMARMMQIAPYIVFQLGYGTSILEDDVDTSFYSKACAVIDNETLPEVPNSQRIRWLRHRNGCRTRINLSKELLSFAISETTRYANGEVVVTYPAYCLRAQLLVAMTLLHELAHAVEFLRFIEMGQTENEYLCPKKFEVYWHTDAGQDQLMHEWGFELELSLLGGGVLHSGTEEAPYTVSPLYGLVLDDMSFFRTRELSTKFWLLSMDWVQWWFLKGNVDQLNARGPTALPPVIDLYILEEVVERGGTPVRVYKLKDGLDITASKRRKLARPALNQTFSTPYRAPDSPCSENSLPASPRSSPHPAEDTVRKSASPAPSNSLPSRTSQTRPHYDLRSSAGDTSSPTDAYAGLTLGHNSSDMVVLRSGPTADGPNHADSSPSKAAADDSPARNSRSSSPAKRRADEMDGYNTADSSDRMELDQSTSALAKSIPDQGQHQDVESGVSSGTPASAQASSTVAADASSATTEVDDDPSIPSLDDQVKWVVEETMKDLEEEGFPGYIISKAWLGRVIARTKYDSEMGPFDKSCMEGEIGRVDNSAIISNEYTHNLKDEKGEPFVPLKKDLSSTTDLQILPKSAWDLIMRWYGLTPPQRPIIRYRHQVNPQDSEQPAEWQYELYPPVFTLRKLQMNKADPSKESPESAQDAPIVITARSQKYMDFIKIVKNLLAIPLQTKISIGRVLEIQSTSDSYSPAKNLLSMPSPPASRENSPARSSTPMIMTMDDFKKLHDQNQIDVVDVRDESMNENYNGKVNLDTLGLRVDQVLIIQEGANKAKGHMSDAQKKGIAKNLTVRDNASETSSGRASPAGGMMTRGRYRSQGRAKGTIGLTNLGNTCYMNSALQCMRACQELTLYFLGTTWKRELNTQNPLGHKGHIAQVYADLLHNIYDGSQYSYTPRQFKTTLGKFAPMFSGYGQQDSQEFMSFLVDGLHEDLNRILKKPYIENPESDDNTVNDPEAIRELGQKYREIYQARNSSVITDLFSGSYKNKLVCPVCNKISINFDPFLLLTLQLPLEHHWEFTFTFVPLKAKPYHIRIDNSKGATIRSLKEFVAGKIAGTTPSKLLMTEIFSQKLYRVMEDHTSLPEANIQTRDDMVIYELEDEPTNWPPPPKKFRSMLEVDAKDDTPPQKDVNERQLVMIQHRSVSQHSYSHNKSIVLWPTFITVTKEEASNYDEILRKILRAVSNQSHRDLDELVEIAARKTESDNTDSESPPEYVEGEMSVDEEKAGDSNVEAESLDDDDFVDVKMTNSDDSQQDSPPISTSQVPHWLEKGAPIPDILRKLFEVCAVQASDPLPTGYTQPDWNRAYSPIKERIPKPAPEPEESDKSGNSPEPIVDASEDDATEDADEQHNDDTSQMSIVESESESPPLIKPGSSRNRKNFRGGKKNKQQQKHGQKGRRNTPPKNIHKKTVPASQDTEHTSGDERLIRNNEMIILDWNPEAFHGLFESQRGGDTKKSMDLLEDVELDKRTEQRESRRKRGMNLEECFEETSKAEILTEDNAWYCPNCKERRLASKQLQLWTVPDILVIHLKRFSSGRGLRDKIDVLVDFPVEGLDLNGKVGVDEDKNLVYDLFAVDNHYGGLGGGHYTAFAKNFYDDEWYEYNDSSVTKRQAHTVVTPAAYLLFYRRRSTHPLGSPELQKIVDRAMNGGTPDFETESRSSSPDQHDSKSGNDRALDDLYPNGSSSALVGPVAARPLPRAGSVRAEPRTVGGDIFGALEDEDEDAADAPPALHEERLPMYGEHFSEVDEGIGMDDGEADDAEDYSLQSHNIHHPMPPPNWSFDNLSRPYGNQSYDDDQTSNVAADGDDEDEEYNASGGKMNEDFSYEEQHDGTFVHDDRRWTAQQVEESRKPPSSPVLAATAAEGHDEEEDIIPSVEVDMADAGERVKHE